MDNTLELTDLCLRFPDKETADDLLADYTGAIDIIGTIYKVVDDSDPENPVMKTLSGWHVNVRGPKDSKLLPYAVTVATPLRVWM
jgi:hypothetical protein